MLCTHTHPRQGNDCGAAELASLSALDSSDGWSKFNAQVPSCSGGAGAKLDFRNGHGNWFDALLCVDLVAVA